ncbi:hypothetical protein AB8A28_21375 [Tardiphaga sp. 71_E8_N1_1]|uniref:hypothetical protein n=1 Tax=Tardiphaga sp. 71_E8_N1_1 TaxID=3240784 RepID=UPI003F89AEDE
MTVLVTKLEAAQKQLDCAIRLFFDDDDMCSIVTLSRASFRLLYDLYPRLTTDGFEKPFEEVIKKLGWNRFNEVTNFLKHADRDHDSELDIDEVNCMTGIGLSVILYGRIKGQITREMRAWETYMTVAQPATWDATPDPKAEGYGDFIKAVEFFKTASREERLSMGRGFLAELRNLPDPPLTW